MLRGAARNFWEALKTKGNFCDMTRRGIAENASDDFFLGWGGRDRTSEWRNQNPRKDARERLGGAKKASGNAD